MRLRRKHLDQRQAILQPVTGQDADRRDNSGPIRTDLHVLLHYAVSMRAALSKPSSLTACSRIKNFWILPVTVIGKASTNVT